MPDPGDFSSDPAPEDATPPAGLLRSLLIPSTPCALALLIFLAVCLTPDPKSLLSWDTFLHVFLGEQMLREGARVEVDVSTWAIDHRYLDHEWLPQLFLGAFRLAFGLEGLVLFSALGTGATLWLVALWMGQKGVQPPIAAALTAAALLALRPFIYARPFLISWILAVLFTRLLERLIRGELTPLRWLALSLPMMILWANLHGGFFLGFFLLGIFGLAQLWRIATSTGAERRAAGRLFLFMLGGGHLLALASGLNAYGFKLHAHFLAYLANTRLITLITEWQAPYFHDARFLALLLLTGFFLFIWLASPGRLAPVEVLLATGLLLTSLKAQRNLPFFVLLNLPFVAAHLEQLLAELGRPSSWLARPARFLTSLSRDLAASESRRGGALLAALVVFFLGWAVGIRKIAPVEIGGKFPVEAVRFIQQNPDLFHGKMFNPYPWGGYLAWALHPTHRVFINGLQDHYGAPHFFAYQEVTLVRQGWQNVLDGQGIDWIIYNRNRALTTVLGLHSGWQRVYGDALSEIFVRSDPAHEDPVQDAAREDAAL